MANMQQAMQAKLEQVGLPFKEINVYGSQIMVTSWSEKAATSWAHLLGRFAKVRSIVKSVDEAKKQKGTVLRMTYVKVWRTWATIT